MNDSDIVDVGILDMIAAGQTRGASDFPLVWSGSIVIQENEMDLDMMPSSDWVSDDDDVVVADDDDDIYFDSGCIFGYFEY